MLQTLLRIPLDKPWSLGPLGEVPGFGFGIVLLLWFLLGAGWLYQNIRAAGLSRELWPSILFWLVIATVIVALPGWVAPDTVRIAALQPAAENGRSSQVTLENPTNQTLRLDRWHLRNRRGEIQGLTGNLLPREGRTIPLGASGGFLDEYGDEIRLIDPQGRSVHEVVYTARDVQPGAVITDPGKSVPVYGYGFMLFLGFVTGGWLAAFRARRVGLDAEVVWDLAMWIFVSGIAGARTFYILQYPNRIYGDAQTVGEYLWATVNLPDGGLVLYGGVLLALSAYFLFCHRRKIPPLLMADVMIPSFFIGLAFGRMGCFLNGCCYGDPCSLPWAVTFPRDSVPYAALVVRGYLSPEAAGSLPLHPTQLYSSFNALVLAILTATYFKYRQRDGMVLALALVAYPVTRFVIEFLRFDESGQFGTFLTISQWVSLGIFVFGLAFLLWLKTRPAVLTRPTA